MLSKPGSKLARVIKFYLDVAWWAGLLFGAVLVFIVPWFLVSLPEVDPPPDLNLVARFALPGAPQQAEQQGLLVRGQGELRVLTGSRLAWVLHFSAMYLVLFVVLFATWQLRALLRTVLAGQPFAPENAGRIRKVGLVVAGWGLLVPFAKYAMAAVVLRELSVSGVVLKPPIDIRPDVVLLGLAILVLAEVFHHASLLQRDQSLTI